MVRWHFLKQESWQQLDLTFMEARQFISRSIPSLEAKRLLESNPLILHL